MSATKKPVLLQGNIACAMGALKAGATFFGGYPITPSTEIAEYMAANLPKNGGRFVQMEDEIASIGAIIGASSVGHKAITATSGPGFSLMQELLGYACNCEIPIVIANVMRSGPSTGLPTLPAAQDVMQARWGTHGDHSIIAISPASVKETYIQTIKAFNLAEKYCNPVIILLDEKIGHLREDFSVSEDEIPEIISRKTSSDDENYLPYRNTDELVPELIPLGNGKRYHITGLTHNEAGFYTQDPEQVEKFLTRICNKIENNKKDICEYETFNTEDADVVIVAYGAVSRSAHEAMLKMRKQGKKVGLMRLITLWPFDEEAVNSICGGKKLVFMPEMNLGQMSREVERAIKGTPFKGLYQVNGDLIAPNTIVEGIYKAMEEKGEEF